MRRAAGQHHCVRGERRRASGTAERGRGRLVLRSRRRRECRRCAQAGCPRYLLRGLYQHPHPLRSSHGAGARCATTSAHRDGGTSVGNAGALELDVSARGIAPESPHAVRGVAAPVEDDGRGATLAQNQPRSHPGGPGDHGEQRWPDCTGPGRPRNLRDHFHHRPLAPRHEHDLDGFRRRTGAPHAQRWRHLAQRDAARSTAQHAGQPYRCFAAPRRHSVCCRRATPDE